MSAAVRLPRTRTLGRTLPMRRASPQDRANVFQNCNPLVERLGFGDGLTAALSHDDC